MLTIGVVDAGNVSGDLTTLTPDAQDPDWRCSPTSSFVLPSTDEVLARAENGIDTPLGVYEAGTAVGFAMVRNENGQLRWFIADTERFQEVLTLVCRYVIDTMGLIPWGVVEGTNNRLAAMWEHPNVGIESQRVVNNVLYTTVRWTGE